MEQATPGDRRRLVERDILAARHLWEHGELTEREFREQERLMLAWLEDTEQVYPHELPSQAPAPTGWGKIRVWKRRLLRTHQPSPPRSE